MPLLGCSKCQAPSSPVSANASAPAVCPACGHRSTAPAAANPNGPVWYYAAAGAPSGPVSWEALRALAASGQLRPDAKVCRRGMDHWQEARTVAGLYSTSPAPAAVAPTPVKAPPAVAASKPIRRRRWMPWTLAGMAGVAALAAALFFVPRPTVPGPGPVIPDSVPGKSEAPPSLGWQYEYGNHGALTRVVDPAGRETKIRYERDAKDRVVQRVEERPDGSKVIDAFDPFGRPIAVTDSTGTVHQAYDGYGRLTEVRRDGAPALAYEYDASNRVASVSVGGKRLVGYSYDFRQRLSRLSTAAGDVAYAYPPGNDEVQRTLPNGVRTVWHYRPDGKLRSLEHDSPNGQALALAIRFEYSYRPDGLLREVQETTPDGKRALTYDYDTVGRLTSFTDSQKGSFSYKYDAFGNRTEVVGPDHAAVAGACDWAGRLTKLGEQPCTADVVGNLTGYFRGQEAVSFDHGIDNRLKTARTAAGEVQYEHDAANNLVARASGGRKTSYLSDPTGDVWRPLLATEPDGRQTYYLWAGDVPLAALTGTDAHFFLEDRQGSVRCVADAKGHVTERCDYDPFGTPQYAVAGGLRPGFAGLFYDADAKLYLTRVRDYDPALGRFLQRDPRIYAPLASQEELSAYDYCGADPVNWIDLSGASREDCPNPDGCKGKPAVQDLDRATGSIMPGDPKAGYAGSVEDHPGQSYYPDPNGSGTKNSVKPDGTSVADSWQVKDPPGLQDMYKPLQQDLRNLEPHLDFSDGPRRIEYQSVTCYADGTPDKRETDNINKIKERQPDAIIIGVSKPTDKDPIPRVNYYYDPRTRTERTGAPPPTNLGGVKLGGAGEALKDLGRLKGVAVDPNGRLVLITSDKGDVELPPLRLDDVVTIFRAAYGRGQAPYVSIDPDAKDPQGPTMNIRHSPGTEDTYVGWVLFEADRVMKAYGLGSDNETGEPIETAIPGYGRIFDHLFDDPRQGENDKDKPWARFWIVPASVTRRPGVHRRLTLLDVPLKVDTRVCVPKNGMMEDVPGAKSTPLDAAFAGWFSEHYNDLARDVFSTPPPESGMTERVPIFAELQRLALISAIAEQLRDQNVPMPAWMRDYPVKPFLMPKTTKSLNAPHSRTQNGVTRTASVFGGAEMSPPQDMVKTIPSPEADALAPDVMRAVAAVPAFTTVRFEHDGQSYRAVALPGDDTRGLGACRLDETDLALPLADGAEVRLDRAFDSFHQPTDVLGGAWTLDLPRMDVYQRPAVDGKHLDSLYQLSSPLGTWCEFFGKQEQVAGGPNFPISVPNKPGPMLGAWTEQGGRIVIQFRDGRYWYFDKDGCLVERRELPTTMVYQRDAQHRVTRIEGRYGQAVRASIDLTYDDNGRLVQAAGSDGRGIAYRYDAAGSLTEVRGPGGVLSYRYQDGRVAEAACDGKVMQQFEYTPQGELRGLAQGNGPKLVQETATVPEGIRITIALADRPEQKETILYDPDFRPLQQITVAGARMDWHYQDGGDVALVITPPGGEPMTVRRSARSGEDTLRLPSGGEYVLSHDDAGRPTKLVRDGKTVRTEKWDAEGRPELIEVGGTAYRPAFNADGLPTSLDLRPSDGSAGWMQVQYNEQGKPSAVHEWGGASLLLDQAGRPVEWSPYEDPEKKTKKDRLTIRRDAQGRMQAVETTWGYHAENHYGTDGAVQEREITEGGQKETIAFVKGRPTLVHQFDGGELHLAYCEDGPAQGKVRESRLPSGLVLKYDYDDRGRLTSVTCGNVYRLVYNYDDKDRLTGLTQVPADR